MSGKGKAPVDHKILRLKLLIDRTRNKVIFAESDVHFVDTLFSFLTLPLGTVMHLFRWSWSGSTQIGSITQIYGSVLCLYRNLFQSIWCKEILLNPRNALETQCSDLKININPITKFYKCGFPDCADRHVSTINSWWCGEGHDMWKWAREVEIKLPKGDDDGNNGVFIKGGGTRRFIITDDLQVMGGSTTTCLLLLNKLGIDDLKEVEERNIEITQKEVLDLLKFSLVSNSPLTEAFLSNKDFITAVPEEFEQMKKSAEIKKTATTNLHCIRLQVVVSKSKKRVLYAEAGNDMVDFLFSFLTFPLGSIVNLLGRNSSLWCMDNLYRSVEDLSTANYIKSDECKKMLVSPKLAPLFGITNQLLPIEEASHPQSIYWHYGTLRLATKADGGKKEKAIIMDPKSPTRNHKGKGFMKGLARFMITDDLTVTPVSPISSIAILNRLDVSVNDVETHMLTMGKDEALKLMKASLHSQTVLTDVFYPPKSVFLADDEGMEVRGFDSAPFPPTTSSVFHWVLRKYCFDWVLDKH